MANRNPVAFVRPVPLSRLQVLACGLPWPWLACYLVSADTPTCCMISCLTETGAVITCESAETAATFEGAALAEEFYAKHVTTNYLQSQ